MARTKQTAYKSAGGIPGLVRPSPLVKNSPRERLRVAASKIIRGNAAKADMQAQKQSSKTAHNREFEVHGICEQLLNKVETLEQALEVKGDECRKLEETVEAHEERIEELVGKESENAATPIRRGTEQITQLQRVVEELEFELAEEKKKNNVNKQAQEQLDKIQDQWFGMAGLMGAQGSIGPMARGTVKEEPIDLDG